MKCFSKWAVGLVSLIGFVQAASAQENPYQNLLRRLPDSTNAVVMMDVQGMRQALGAKPGTMLAAAGVASIPDTASKFVMGTEIDLMQRQHLWSVALAQLDSKMSIQDIATAENEPVEKLVGYSIVPSQRNAYFVELGSNTLAVCTPGDRQELKRWLSHQKADRFSDLTAYLKKAVNPKEPALMILAVDLTDDLDYSAIRRGLNNSRVMAGRRDAPDYEKVTNVLAAAQGMTMIIKAGSPLNGQLTVTFAAPSIGPISHFAKDLLLESLQKTGLYVRDFEDWGCQIGDDFIQIKGPLTLHGLRELGTLIKTPAPEPFAANPASYASMTPAERSLQASKTYFKSITRLLSDLRSDKAPTVRALAGWYDQFAGQIDKLPIQGVDPGLVNFGLATSRRLRALNTSYNGISLELGYLQQNKNTNKIGFAPIAGQGYWGYAAGAQSDTMKQNAAVAKGADERAKLWARIDDETAQVRRQMALKFMVEF